MSSDIDKELRKSKWSTPGLQELELALGEDAFELYMVLGYLSRNTWRVTITDKHLGREAEMGQKRLKAAIKQLKRAGLIHATGPSQDPMKIYVIYEPISVIKGVEHV